MSNLVAYIPTLNQRHLNWFKDHPESDLLLIPQAEAERLLPRLSRNMAALPTEILARMISSLGLVSSVQVAYGGWRGEFILPDEDVSHLFAEEHLAPAGCGYSFEMIWARYDMSAVTRSQPVIADVEISSSDFHRGFMERAYRASERSPDWWRRVGALAVSSDGQVMVASCNTHMPNEYETYIFGDPGLNRDAGQAGKYTVLHAEEAVVAYCSRQSVLSLNGSRMYVTTFPCEGCARLIAAAGVATVFFREGFSSLNAQDVLRTAGVEIVRVMAPE